MRIPLAQMTLLTSLLKVFTLYCAGLARRLGLGIVIEAYSCIHWKRSIEVITHHSRLTIIMCTNSTATRETEGSSMSALWLPNGCLDIRSCAIFV
jgi:hypothetical protein